MEENDLIYKILAEKNRKISELEEKVNLLTLENKCLKLDSTESLDDKFDRLENRVRMLEEVICENIKIDIEKSVKKSEINSKYFSYK